ncbi:hypothetical protein DYY67_0256 [Candidatus Nitrosotalea sp. TS]|uniref:hypothetical protein n=1 Tax=Candidatus Nitrosotalea sp. TS TaxID=2341020 RepID=UPI001C49A523|nr:hypothetical protein [Candidatus Nitrosotalea sp. TS]NHI03135.1 hypothetical protein [Candidatus Nitrosotalea sp. TS]
MIILVITVACYPKMSFEQIPANNTISVNSTRFVIPHIITNGTILAINLDSQSKSMTLTIKTTNAGSLIISLPRTLIDARDNGSDSHFTVLTNKHGVNFQELTTQNYRQLTIPFANKTSTIEIIGTQIIPEFGGLVTLTLVSSVLLTIAMASKTKLRF